MESGVSSNCTCDIHRPSTPKNEVNRKENTVERSLRKATDSKAEACSYIDLGEVLSHYVMFCTENRALSSKIYRVSFGGIAQDFRDR